MTLTPSRPVCPVSTSPVTSPTRATSNKPSKSHAASSLSSPNLCALPSNDHRRGLKLRLGEVNKLRDARERNACDALASIACLCLQDDLMPSCGQMFDRPLGGASLRDNRAVPEWIQNP